MLCGRIMVYSLFCICSIFPVLSMMEMYFVYHRCQIFEMQPLYTMNSPRISTQKKGLSSKAQRCPPIPPCAGESLHTHISLFHMYDSSMIYLYYSHAESIEHLRFSLPWTLDKFLSCSEAVAERNLIHLFVNWILPPRKPEVPRFCFQNTYCDLGNVL